VSGIPTPTGTNPCSVSPASLTDVDLSTEATPSSSTFALPTNASAVDSDPDWSPTGNAIVLDSRRGGGRTLFVLSNPTTDPTIAPLFPAEAVPGGVTAIEPVYSPDGNDIAYVEPEPSVGTQVEVYDIATRTSTVALSLAGGKPSNSQPDWQSISADPADQTPETPMVWMLPGAASVLFAGAIGVRRRGRRASA
jgi:Tol biopolymer transport system component